MTLIFFEKIFFFFKKKLSYRQGPKTKLPSILFFFFNINDSFLKKNKRELSFFLKDAVCLLKKENIFLPSKRWFFFKEDFIEFFVKKKTLIVFFFEKI